MKIGPASVPVVVPPRAVVYAYPWTFHDVGIARAIDALHGCGLDGLQLALSYHIATYLTPRGQGGRVRFGDHGALHFKPDVDRLRAFPFPPILSDRCHSSAYLGDIVAAASGAGIRTIAWLVYLFNHELAQARPELAVRNVFGDVNEAHLCPSNPTVRAYAVALTRAALSAAGFDGLHVEALALMRFDHGFLNPKAAVAPCNRARQLLGLCFCRHCQQSALEAGIPVDDLAVSLRRWTAGHLNRLPDATLADEIDEPWPENAFGGALSAYRASVAENVFSLHHEILGLAGAAGLRVGSDLVEMADDGLNDSTPSGVRAMLDELRVSVEPEMKVLDIANAVETARSGAREGATVFAFYQLGHFDSEADFVRAVDRAVSAGLLHHRFYELSIFSRRQFEWLRAARRSWD